MKILKIVIAGSYGSGKTTFVKTLSEVVPLETEVNTSDPRGEKRTTTVAFDYGRIAVRSDLVVHLFGLPGQERFSFLWRGLSRGMYGYILMVDSTSLDTVKESIFVYGFLREFFPYTPHVVAANKQDLPNHVPPEEVRKLLEVPSRVKVLPLVAKDKEMVVNTLISLLEEIKLTGEY